MAIKLQRGTILENPPKDIKHALIATKPAKKIYLGLAGGEQASDITMAETGSAGSGRHFNYIKPNPPSGWVANGSSSIASDALIALAFYPSAYQHANQQNKYIGFFLPSFIKTKFPINVKIGTDRPAYNLRWFSSSSVTVNFSSSVVASSADRVSASDLTKAINFELVDNEQVVSRVLNNGYRMDVTGGSTGVVYDYRTSGSTNQKWAIWRPTGTVFDKTVTGIIINGRRYSATYNNDPSNPFYTTDVIQDTGFYPTATGQSFGVNVEFSDETYWLNTRSKLFSTPDKKLVWENQNPPTILTFTASPATFDLDSATPANVTLTWTAPLDTTKTQTSKVYLVPEGTRIGQIYTTAPNADVSETFTNPRPTKDQIYRLLLSTDAGTSAMDALVQVTQNAVIQNFRKTSFIRATPTSNSGTYVFQATIKGYPQPDLSYRFGNGTQGSITKRHITPVSGQTNTWNLNWDVFHSVQNDSLVLTATNSSNTVTATIANIGT